MLFRLPRLAWVFPLATLRVLEASKQTNSTIARFSAEPLVDVDPSFLHNPDATLVPGGIGPDRLL